jgi:hypothetical protein
LKRCREVIGVTAELDVQSVGFDTLLGNNEQSAIVLDVLEFDDLLSVIKGILDRTPYKLQSKIVRKLKSYAKNSRREEMEKGHLEIIIKMYKESSEPEEEKEKEEGAERNAAEGDDVVQQRKRKPRSKESSGRQKQAEPQQNEDGNELEEFARLQQQ